MARRVISGLIGFSQGSPGALALRQWTHSRLHQVPVIWIHKVEKRRKGTRGASAGGAVQLITGRLMGPFISVLARRSHEDAVGHERRDDPVGGVHDLADLEVGGHAADDVGLFPGEATLRDEM